MSFTAGAGLAPSRPRTRCAATAAPGSRRSCACGPCGGTGTSRRTGTTGRPGPRPRIDEHVPLAHRHQDRNLDPRGLGQGRARSEAPQGGGDRDGGRARAGRRRPGREVVLVAFDDGRVDVVPVEAPRHGVGGEDLAGSGLQRPALSSRRPRTGAHVPRHPRHRHRRRARRGGRLGVERAVAQDRDAVVVVEPALLDDRRARRPSTGRCRRSAGRRPARARRPASRRPGDAAPPPQPPGSRRRPPRTSAGLRRVRSTSRRRRGGRRRRTPNPAPRASRPGRPSPARAGPR